jgi:PAS domain S-box-containing protein
LAAQTLLGYVPETLQQTPWLELIHVSDQALIENCWQYLQTQAEAPPCTVRCLCGSALQAAGNNDAGNNDGGNNDGGNNDAVSAYVSVGVTFTATYDGAGALEHVLLWLTGQASNHNSINHSPFNHSEVNEAAGHGQPSNSLNNNPNNLNNNLPNNLNNNPANLGAMASPETRSSQQLAGQYTHDDRVIARDLYLDDRPSMTAVIDRQWRLVYVSDVAVALLDQALDQAAEDVIGQTLWQVLPTMQHNQAGQAFRQAMDTGQPLYYEFLSEDEHLQRAWHGVQIIPFEDRLIVSVKDITEQKASEQRIMVAKHHAEVLLDQRNAILGSIGDYFYILNKDYRFVYANQAVLDLFAETPATILNRTVWDMVDLPADNPFRHAYVKAVSEQLPQRVRYRSSHPKLLAQTLEISLYPFQGGVIAYSRDVTESTKLRAELRQALADKKAILDSITDAVTVLDREGVYLYANEQVRRRVPDIIGKAYIELFPEHQVSIFETYYQQAFDSQEVVCFEAQTHRGHWMDVRVYPDGDRITIFATDISELKRSEEKYRNLFENMMHEVHLWKLVRDEQGEIKTWRLVEANPAALKAWDKTRADIIGKTTNEIFSYDATEQFMPIVKKIVSEGTFHTWDAYFPPTGQFQHMTSVSFGEYFMSTGVDITERKRLEQDLLESNQKLQDSQAKFRAFFEDSHTAHFILNLQDSDQAVERFITNSAFDRLFADTLLATTDRYLSLADYQVISRQLTDDYYPLLELGLQGEEHQTRANKRYLNRDGSSFWVDASSVFVRNKQGEASMVISTIVDISEQKRIQQALKTSEAKFRAFFENNNTPCTMFIFDPSDEWEQGFHFNDAFANFLKDTAFAEHSDRLSSIEDTLRALSTVSHPEDNAKDERYVAEVVAGERDDYHFEKRYFARDGSILWGDISSLFLRDDQGELTLGMSIIQDITKRKRAQAALEKALADKDLLLKEVHHRTKNNMQLISSRLALQSRRIADELAREALVDSSKRINLLANMHRTLYQTADGEMINVGEQLSGLVSSLVASFRKDLTIYQDIAASYLDVQQAIPVGLIANELLTNVFKHAFVEARAEDTLTVRLLQASAATEDASGDMLTLEVQDNGAGLSTEYPQDHLGMVIIESLAQQLEATFTLSNVADGGCLAQLCFRKRSLQLN